MNRIAFTIPWQVEPKQSARFAKAGRFMRSYQPAKVVRNSEALTLLALQHKPPAPMRGALRVDVTYEFPWRAGDSQKKRRNGPAWKDTKPDLDNLTKQVLDVLQSAGFYQNDAQIAVLKVSKMFCGHGRTHVAIEALASVVASPPPGGRGGE